VLPSSWHYYYYYYYYYYYFFFFPMWMKMPAMAQIGLMMIMSKMTKKFYSSVP